MTEIKRKSWIKRLTWKSWVIISMWVFTLIGIAAVATLFSMAKNEKFGPMPSFEELENPKTNIATEIYSADGAVLGTYFIENRTPLSYHDLFHDDKTHCECLYIDGHELPPIVAALIATEDVRFFDHSGIDLTATARVGFKTILMGQGEQGGGSTITQQLAKNLFKTRQNNTAPEGKAGTIAAKLQEYVIAVQLEHNYTKEEIIAMYLNTVEFSNSNFGIKSAAMNFFGKKPHELSIEEAAVIIGQVKAPTTYALVRNGKPNEKARERRNLVLKRMAEAGAITQAKANELSKLPVDLSRYRRADEAHNEGTATYFREMVRSTMTATAPVEPKRSNYSTKLAYDEAMWDYQIAMKEWNTNPLIGWCNKNTNPNTGKPYDIYRDGLRIYTTLDSRMQRYAEEATQEHMAEVVQPRFNEQSKQRGSIYTGLSQKQINAKIESSMRYSDRWYRMAEHGCSEEEIRLAFDTPTKMQVFTYKGVRDTVMTPRDSIIHHKSIMRPAFVAMDPKTGYVRAYVGGPDYRFFKFDGAKQGKRQVGSTAKPFIYTFAIDHLKLEPCHPVPNVPVSIETIAGQPWTPKESGNVEYTGTHPLYWGLAKSRNNYSAWIMKEANNPQAVADFIHHMGVKSFIDPVVSLCLGSYQTNPYDMTAAYCTFSNHGVRIDPIFVTRIEDSHGNVLADFTSVSYDVLSKDVAYTMITMMQQVVRIGTAQRLHYEFKFNDVEIAAKTGTTNDNVDAWFMCALPNLVMGSWVGGEENTIHFSRNADGSRIALPIAGKFLTKVFEDGTLGVQRTDKFERSENVPSYDCPIDMDSDTGRSTQNINDDPFGLY